MGSTNASQCARWFREERWGEYARRVSADGLRAERACVQTREWILTAAVIVVPLIIAVVVTLWSLDQVRYRPKRRRPPASVARETPAVVEPDEPESKDAGWPREDVVSGGREGFARAKAGGEAESRH